MTDEHGWPGDFHDPHGHDPGHDDPGHHGFDLPDEPGGLPAHDDGLFHDDLFGPEPGLEHADLGGHDGGHLDSADFADEHEPGTGHDDASADTVVDVTDGHAMGPVGTDPDAAPDVEPAGLFPPAVDVGPLPEPVDGFPWIDTGSLGLLHAGPIDPAALAHTPVRPEELAEYAAEELAPGVDPWAALADSDDPATSTLAKWWSHDT